MIAAIVVSKYVGYSLSVHNALFFEVSLFT